mmetsp:Transcript_147473/g.209339  ORF Transcript_147473/g.209339 Transcript_147473/m.209339 type:complete len:807 (+) Transcript_147473:64-2484(+)
MGVGNLQPIKEVVKRGDGFLETLASPGGLDDGTDLGVGVIGVTTNQLPMVKDALREGLARSGTPEGSSEAKGLNDGQVGLAVDNGRTGPLLLREQMATTLVEHTVDAADGGFGGLDLHQEDGLQQGGGRGKLGSVQHTPASGDDLSSTSVDGISVQGDVGDVVPARTHVLLAQDTLASGPLEGGDARVLDFIEVLHTLGHVNDKVGTGGVGTKAPNLLGLIGVKAKVFGESAGADLGVITGANLAVFDGFGQAFGEGLTIQVDTVVLVGALGQADGTGFGDGFPKGDHGVRGDELDALAEILGQILQANLQMELASAGDNLLSGFRDLNLAHGIRLGQPLETLDQLGQIGGVLALDGNPDHRADTELHDADVVSLVRGGDGSTLDQELVNADQGDGVATGAIVNLLNLAGHHEHGALDGLVLKQVGGASGAEVGTHQPDLLARGNGAREHTAKGVEPAVVRGGHHLGDVHHQGTIGITVGNGLGALVVHGAFVQVLHTVLLGDHGAGQMQHNHLQQGFGSGQPLAHHSLQQRLASQLLLFVVQLDLELLDQGQSLGLRLLHAGVKDGLDGLEDELAEGPGQVAGLGLGPLLALHIKVLLTPKTAHHLFLFHAKLGSVHHGKLAQSETPAVQTRAKGNGTLSGINLHVTEQLVVIGGNDHIGRLDGTREGLVGGFTVKLEFQEGTVHLVDHEHGLDTLTKSLPEHSLGLDAHAFHAVDDHKGTIGHTQGSSHFRGEIHMAWGINQVDQETRSVVQRNALHEMRGQLIVQRHTGGLDGNATVLLVLTSVSVPGLTGSLASNDTSLGHQ